MHFTLVTLAPTSTTSATSDLTPWVQQAQQGNKVAFEELVRRTESLIKKTVYPLLDSHQVNDAIQETYLICYQKLHHLREPKAFLGWLVRIAIHSAYALRKKNPLLAEADLKLEAKDDTLTIDLKLDLKAALNRLTADDRNVLILREMLALSYEEIAYSLRLPVGTVRSRIHYGRQKLAKLLKPST